MIRECEIEKIKIEYLKKGMKAIYLKTNFGWYDDNISGFSIVEIKHILKTKVKTVGDNDFSIKNGFVDLVSIEKLNFVKECVQKNIIEKKSKEIKEKLNDLDINIKKKIYKNLLNELEEC